MPRSVFPVAASNADIKSLVDLLQTRVAPESWLYNGLGAGEIQFFPANLSLIISQTDAVHGEVAALLQELRCSPAKIAGN